MGFFSELFSGGGLHGGAPPPMPPDLMMLMGQQQQHMHNYMNAGMMQYQGMGMQQMQQPFYNPGMPPSPWAQQPFKKKTHIWCQYCATKYKIDKVPANCKGCGAPLEES